MTLQRSDALFTPDAGQDALPYTCSYHTLRLDDGRLLILDIVRSDDTGRRCLRVFLSDRRGGLRSLVAESPSDAWSPFATTPAGLDRSRNVVARGPQWVAGDVRRGDGPDLGLQHVAFELDLRVEASALRSDTLGLAFLHMTVEDHPRVHHRGWVEIDGERITVDGPGAVSVHFGERLCSYAYILSPPTTPPSCGLLLAAVAGDDVRHLGALLGERVATYTCGWQGLPPLALNVGTFEHPLHLSPGRQLHLVCGPPIVHTFLGQPSITALARAEHHQSHLLTAPEIQDLGEVVIEARGEPFHRVLRDLAP